MRVDSRHHRLHHRLHVVLMKLRRWLMMLQQLRLLQLSLWLDFIGDCFGRQAFIAKLLVLNVLCQSTLHAPLVNLAHCLMQTQNV